MPHSAWQNNLVSLLRENNLEIKTENPTKFKNGIKYALSPSVEFKDLKGVGSPISNKESRYKGWISPKEPETQSLLKNLKRYICEKLELDFDEEKPVSLTLYNYPNYLHPLSACYPFCEKVNESIGSGAKPLCLRTWVYNDIHRTKGEINKNVIEKPWFNLPVYGSVALSEVSGKISSIYVTNETPPSVKFWCNVDYGVVEPNIANDKFSDRDFMNLVE